MTENTKPIKRPLSPHLQTYRLPITALMSISHRITGAALIFGAIFISAWFIAAVMGEEYYNQLMAFSKSKLGIFVLAGWSLALFYHLFNGIRHLLWDVGVGLNKCGACKGNFLIILLTILSTVGVWAYSYDVKLDSLKDIKAKVFYGGEETEVENSEEGAE